MAAPSVPVLTARHDGNKVYARWKSVPGATSYKLYAGEAAAPTTLAATIDASAEGTDGRFQYVLKPDWALYLRLTALTGAEESDYSNELNFIGFGSMTRHR